MTLQPTPSHAIVDDAPTVDVLGRLQLGLAALRGIGTVSVILDRATQAACESCGFDRSILFRVRGGQIVAESVYSRGDPQGAAALLEHERRHPGYLDRLPAETEMVRRRTALIVVAPRSHTYVAAPIMPAGKVIGFLRADHQLADRDVAELDRMLLWAFTEGFGFAYERTVLRERMRQQREQVTELVSSVDDLLGELAGPEVRVSRTWNGESATRRDAGLRHVRSAPPATELLTPREIQVVVLMADGETNRGIGSRLALSEGTVKTHIKHILAKLGAANRAEAVSRFLTLGIPYVDGER